MIPLDLPVTLIGHPFAPIGRGEDLRSSYRAFRAAGVAPRIVDVYGGAGSDDYVAAEMRADTQLTSAGGVDLFCINGDEVDAVLAHLGSRRVPARYSVVFPQWELPRYPETWARQLERFDEVWVPSAFIRDAIAPGVSRPVILIPGPTGVRLARFLGRRYFGIPESAYAFLFAFDLRSYYQRKNPFAVVDAFAQLVKTRPSHDLVLVVKIAGASERPEAAEAVRQRLRDSTSNLGLGRVIILDRPFSDTETKNLVRRCDCFVSLHRSEGFGRFLAEAMYVGKPVIATAYSGNLEFMNPDVSCLVEFNPVPVLEGDYPFPSGQVWAEPNVEQASAWMRRLVDDPAWGRRLGERASQHVRTWFSYRAIGLAYLDRLQVACA
jgi:glycosyltransferase involved in cell wall biosynthesis